MAFALAQQPIRPEYSLQRSFSVQTVRHAPLLRVDARGHTLIMPASGALKSSSRTKLVRHSGASGEGPLNT